MGNVIGLFGYPGVGKSEVTKILVEKHDFILINSKTMIYSLASMFTGLPENAFSDPETKNDVWEGVKLRQIAANMGYAIEDAFGEDFLIKRALKNYNVKGRTKKRFVVDSLRLSQPLLLKDEMFLVEVRKRAYSKPTDDYDLYYGSPNYIVQNDSTKSVLEEEVDDLIHFFEDFG